VVPSEHPDVGNLIVELTRVARTAVSKETLAAASKGPAAVLAAFEEELQACGRECGLDGSNLEALVGLTHDAASPGELADWAVSLWPEAEEAIVGRLEHIAQCARELEPLVLRFSLAAARGLGYYTGFTFEVDVPVLGPDVSQVVGGGRYDGVTALLDGPPLGAAGFAVGIERLVAAAELLVGREDLHRRLAGPPPILIMFGDGETDADDAARFGDRLRERRVSLAFHPTPVTDVTDDGLPETTMDALSALPERPYAIAALVSRGRWFVAYLDDRASFAIKRSEALTILSN
jgi:histidyl-tRNA synthetase